MPMDARKAVLDLISTHPMLVVDLLPQAGSPVPEFDTVVVEPSGPSLGELLGVPVDDVWEDEEDEEEDGPEVWSGFILAILEARSVATTPEARARITSCSDTNRLAVWLQRSATVDTVDDLFDRE